MIDHLIENGLLTAAQAARVLEYKNQKKVSAEIAIVELGLLDETKIVSYCKKVLGR